MALYLVQHGKALSKEQDPERRLSDQGREEVKRIAEAAGKHGLPVRLIEHSGKARAKETAEIFAAELHPQGGVHHRDGINPMDDVTIVAGELDPAAGLMLTGHLPFMERLASYLVTGAPEAVVVKFQNGGIVCLDKLPDIDNWFIKWTLLPSLE